MIVSVARCRLPALHRLSQAEADNNPGAAAGSFWQYVLTELRGGGEGNDPSTALAVLNPGALCALRRMQESLFCSEELTRLRVPLELRLGERRAALGMCAVHRHQQRRRGADLARRGGGS